MNHGPDGNWQLFSGFFFPCVGWYSQTAVMWCGRGREESRRVDTGIPRVASKGSPRPTGGPVGGTREGSPRPTGGPGGGTREGSPRPTVGPGGGTRVSAATAAGAARCPVWRRPLCDFLWPLIPCRGTFQKMAG